jgi:DNA-binding response OmpR family regulator
MTDQIVIADDDDAIRELVEFKLDGPDRTVTAFENGGDCWEYLESSEPPDLVVLDVMMPGLTGLQILYRMRKTPALSAVPVIMLTSRGKEEHVVEGFDRGATDYMTKPFSPNELVARANSRLR